MPDFAICNHVFLTRQMKLRIITMTCLRATVPTTSGSSEFTGKSQRQNIVQQLQMSTIIFSVRGGIRRVRRLLPKFTSGDRHGGLLCVVIACKLFIAISVYCDTHLPIIVSLR